MRVSLAAAALAVASAGVLAGTGAAYAESDDNSGALNNLLAHGLHDVDVDLPVHATVPVTVGDVIPVDVEASN